MLPHDLPPWPTAYAYLRLWEQDGTLELIEKVLLSGRRKPRNPSSPAGRTGGADAA